MKIGNHNLNKKTLIIAEIGNNHEGSFLLAKKLIRLASDCGADAVKFQTFSPNNYVSKEIDPARFETLSRFYISYDKFKKLQIYANSLGLIFISTPFDIKSAKFLQNVVRVFKIASSDISFYPLIETICKTKKPLFLSTGIADLSDLKKTIKFIKKFRSLDNVLLMHCVSNYPTKSSDVNLYNIFQLNKIVKYVGYSDHTIGIDAALCSVAMGAKVIEKHFTIDKNYSSFKDHKISANPDEFKNLVTKIRLFEKLKGISKFKFPKINNKNLLRRSISINCNKKSGTVIKKSEITWVRPGLGVSPGNESKFIGKKVKNDLKQGTLLKLKDVI